MTKLENDSDSVAPQPATQAPAAVLRHLPGKARPREEVLREVQEANAKRREGMPAVLWQFWAPDPDEYYRWRVQLGCSCVKEVLTSGDKRLPAETRWLDHVNSARLPTGQLLCSHDDSPAAPYRDIVEWGARREVDFPADPVEPKHGMDARTWALLRHDEPHSSAFWKVTLSCGHVTEVIAPDLDWKPADGPRTVSADRQREMTEDFEKFWADNPDEQDEQHRKHRRRVLAEGWPSPEPEVQCYTCPRARFIVAYQRVGWLVPRKTEPKPPKPPSRTALEQRLRESLAEAERLRGQLAQLDERKTDPPAEGEPG